MKSTLLAFLASACLPSLISASPLVAQPVKARQSCENTATSRDCWGDYSIDTDYYTTIISTGVTREYWLEVVNTTVNVDGYERFAMTFNGTIPGPTIIADWGDDIVIHVTNKLTYNGTAIHWHGIRQLKTSEYDGVPGVTQCPIAPTDTLTYKFHADQYGSSWYHSHFTLQYGDGIQGGIVINGPATANYDVDLGNLFLSDWGHESVFQLWDSARVGAPPALQNALMNGTNTYDCSAGLVATDPTDPNCIGNGKKFEMTVVNGTKYRLRLVNSAVDGHFEFSIDGHEFQVIANDFVPIVPFTTDRLLVSIGQRYDIIVDANAGSGDFWIRGGWITQCSGNLNAANFTGILRYDASSTADPTTTMDFTQSTSCGDAPYESLVPHLALNVGNTETPVVESLFFNTTTYFKWTLNDSSLLLDWSNPTTLRVYDNETIFPTDYNVVPVDVEGNNDWVILVVEDNTGIPLTHPLHLHGHDFWLIGQSSSPFDAANPGFNFTNPPRRDVASLPGGGYAALAFQLDNPGSWLLHCHIAWHASEGLAMQFVESESQIAATITDSDAFKDTCNTWDAWYPGSVFPEDDSGI